MNEEKITVTWNEIQKQEHAVPLVLPQDASGGAPAKKKGHGGILIAVCVFGCLVGLGGIGTAVWFKLIKEPTSVLTVPDNNGKKLDSKDKKSIAAIEQVLEADATCNQGVTSVAEVVIRMRAVDTSACPNDFRSAYLAHVHAWDMMADVEREAISLKAESESADAMIEAFIRGFLGDPFGKVNEIGEAKNQLQRSFKEAARQVKVTFHRVEEIAVAHGASLPRK